MARKDVDLVIRARDEAAKVVDTITKSLNEFIDAQKGLAGSSEKTETSLGQLGAALRNLEGNLKGLSVGAKLTQELGAANAALSRMETRLDATRKEAADLAKQLRDTEAQTARYSQKLAGAVAAQDKQSTAIKRGKADQKELNRAYADSVAALARLEARQTKLPALIDKQAAAAQKAAARYDDLSAQILGTVNPTKTLREQFDASARNVEKTSSKLAELRAEYGSIGGNIRAAGSAMVLFGSQASKATDLVSKQERALAKIGQNLTTLKVQTAASAAQQGKLVSATKKIESSLAGQTAQLEKAETEYLALAKAAGQADAALERLSKQGARELLRTFGVQQKAAAAAKQEYLELSSAATRLGAEVSRAGVPTAKLSQDFQQTVVAARLAKTAYIEQQKALQTVRTAYRGLTGDLESLLAAEARVKSAQNELSAALTRSAEAARKESTQIERVHASATKADQSTRRLTQSTRAAGSAAATAAAQTTRLQQAYRAFYGDTRRSLSLLQRIRGEVLSLVAAYGGLYGAINVLKGTVTATQQLEAAQSRLGVAFDGDQTRVAAELDFLRRTADRLGVSLGVLSTEYSKFNIATKNTSLEGEAARRIFVNVAEAARVNRSSTEELSGVFVALTQIVSKGAVQMEELRQQLGDRLPGAIKIMADGLGVGTEELIKMMEQGQITEAALIPFAEELNRRFGPGLGKALASTSVAIGRLGNAGFQALVKFGQAGFIDSFTDFANTLTEVLKSADFEAFSVRASAALGKVVDVLAFGARNFNLLIAAVVGFLALRLTPLVIAMGSAMLGFSKETLAAVAGLRAVTVAGATATTRLSATAGAVRGLTAAFRGLLSSTGIGLLVSAVAVGLSLWSTQADKATEALNLHRKILDQVKNGYDAVGGAVDKWREKLDTLTATEARKNLKDLQDVLEETTRSFLNANRRAGANSIALSLGVGGLTDASEAYKAAIGNVITQFRNGEIAAADLVSEIDEVNEEFNDGSAGARRYGAAMVESAKRLVEVSRAVEEAEKIVAAKTGTDEEAAVALKALAGAAEDAADAMDPEKSSAYAKAIESLEKIVEDTNDDLEILQDRVKIENAFEDAIANAQTLEERILAAINQAEALDAVTQKFVDSSFGNFTDGNEAAAEVLRQFEGFQPTAKWDVNAFRAGFGSDTITLADGSIRKITEGMRVSVADANRDLIRRIATEFQPIAERAAGSARFATFTPQQQAALISIAYNYGEIPDQIAEAVRNGTNDQIASAIRGLQSDNGGVNQNRRLTEAALFSSTAGQEAQIKQQVAADEERARLAQELLDSQTEFREGLQQEIADQQFQNSIEAEGLIQREVAKALREAELAAQREGLELTAEERKQIEEVTRAKFAKQAAEEEEKRVRESVAAAEEEINRLLEIQRNLREQLTLANEAGDADKARDLKTEISNVNDQMLTAIETARAMWAAIGGPEAEAAITRLDTAALVAKKFGQEGVESYFSWVKVKDLFIGGLTDAFLGFAKAVAEGQSVGESARQAFLQFASDFLLQIAKMIIQQAILNALRAAFDGSGFGALIGLGHTGGLVGSSRVGSGNSSRYVDPGVFAGAMRYHSGGVAGIKPGEVPIIAKMGEEIITKDDPRHMLNAGKGEKSGGSTTSNKIVNAVDGTSFLEQALRGAPGEKVMLNWISANPASIRSALGV